MNSLKDLVVWLEDTKVRYYAVADRRDLQNKANRAWPRSYEKVFLLLMKISYWKWKKKKKSQWLLLLQYLTDLGCPHNKANQRACLNWLISYAIRLEYQDSSKKALDFGPWLSVFFMFKYFNVMMLIHFINNINIYLLLKVKSTTQ